MPTAGAIRGGTGSEPVRVTGTTDETADRWSPYPLPGAAEPGLTRRGPDAARAVVLLLHGGKERSASPVDARSASWKRMAALGRAVGPDLHARGAATWLLAYRRRGWNGGEPVHDARWALDRVREVHGEVPVVLLGHSMGARTAVHVADDPLVRGVVALAPWFPPGEPVRALARTRLLAAHGRRDKITSARATRAFVERAAAVGADAEFRDMGRVGHYMLARVPDWYAVARTGALDLLG